jgi:hypothetical protein
MKKGKQARAAPVRVSAKAGGLAAAAAAMKEAAKDEDMLPPRRKAKPGKKPKTRAGKKGLVLYVMPEVTVALRKLAVENDSDVQRMGWRALELLFAEYKTPLPGAAKAAGAKS